MPVRVPQPEIAGKSAAAHGLRARLQAAAAGDTVCLIEGPVGSGRELAARVLHAASGRAGGPFVVVPCAALAGQLAASELFGHEKGAFTGATCAHAGLIERASGGTLFLAEVGELPADVQPKLLRFLEDRTVTPLGGAEPRRVDVRVVASTGRDLAAEVRAGRFRADLFFRLRVLCIRVPSLAERGEDIVLLAERFVREAAAELGREPPALSASAKEALLVHPWPGNVRELRNCISGALIFARGAEIAASDLDLASAPGAEAVPDGRPAPGGGTLKAAVARVVRETERRLIVEALERHAGNRTRAAKELGMSRRGLQIKMKRYGLS